MSLSIDHVGNVILMGQENSFTWLYIMYINILNRTRCKSDDRGPTGLREHYKIL